MGRGLRARRDLIARVQEMYRHAASRSDVENVELQHFDAAYLTPDLKGGLQVHMAYTTYAHWFLIRRILAGGGTKQIQANIDVDSMSRAAFLSAFVDEVKQGNAHLFYVLFTKSLPIDERRRIMSKSSYARRAFASTMPAELAADRYEVSRQMMKESLKHSRKIGQWGGRVVR